MPWLLASTAQHCAPLRGFQGLNSGHQVWWQIHLLVKSSHWPKPLPSMLGIVGNLKLASLNNTAEVFPMGFSTEQAL